MVTSRSVPRFLVKQENAEEHVDVMRISTQTLLEAPVMFSSQNSLAQREQVGETPRGEVLGVPMQGYRFRST
jgi:predicted ester cyclase